MALIKCPNCKQPISDKAKRCPKCGISMLKNEEKYISIVENEENNLNDIETKLALYKAQLDEEYNKKTIILIVIIILAIFYAFGYFHDVSHNKEIAKENLKLAQEYNISSVSDARLIKAVEENKDNATLLGYKNDRNFESISNIYYANEVDFPISIKKYYKTVNKDSKHIEWVRYLYKNGNITRENFTAEINYYSNKNPLNHYLLNYYGYYEPMRHWSPF